MVLRAALRALDAGEAPKPFGPQSPEEVPVFEAERLRVENEQLRSALARAEEEKDELLELQYIELQAEFATIVERTARAQRDSDRAFVHQWLDGEVHLPKQVQFANEALAYAPLVTLSTLPEADSSGGGGKARNPSTGNLYPLCCTAATRASADAVAAEIASWDTTLCRHCGQPLDRHQGSGVNPRYCGPLTSSTWDPRWWQGGDR